MTTKQCDLTGERVSRVGLCAELLLVLALGACGGDGRAAGLGGEASEGDAGPRMGDTDSGELDMNVDGGPSAVDGGGQLPAEECPEGTGGDACDECLEGHVPSSVYEGACIADPCQGVACANDGRCVVVDDAAECDCPPGWGGDTCSVCADGYIGDACDGCDAGWSNVAPLDSAPECVPDVCLTTDCGHGTCTLESPATAVCECDRGYIGDGACDTCAPGWLAKDDNCVLELPVINDMLTLHLDMADRSHMADDDKHVLEWRSQTPGGGEQTATYEGDVSSSPTVLRTNGLTVLNLDGTQHLRLPGVKVSESRYTIFIAMNPDSTGGATMAAFAAVGSSDTNKHGILIRSEAHGTQLRYLHRSPVGTTGGDNLYANIDDPGLLDPFQIITAERRVNPQAIIHQLLHFDTFDMDKASTNPKLGAAAMDLLIGVQSGAGTAPFKGFIGEIVVYNGSITLEERELVRAYLKAKWVPTVPDHVL